MNSPDNVDSVVLELVKEYLKKIGFVRKSGIILNSRIFYIICFSLFLFSFLSFYCAKDSDEVGEGKFRIGIVFDAAGKDDKSFMNPRVPFNLSPVN